MDVSINYSLLPERMQGDMKRYVEEGIPPGDFLRAVLENKLMQSFQLADDTNVERMWEFANFLYNELPSGCWGSVEKVVAWIQKGGLNQQNIKQ